jgi:hypothetical protein
MRIYKELEALGFFEWLDETHNLKDAGVDIEYLDGLALNDLHRTVCNAMVFRWFREKYGVHMSPKKFDVNKWWVEWGEWSSPVFETYEEVEFDCIIKLIEIAKL